VTAVRYTELDCDLVQVYPGGFTGSELSDFDLMEDEDEFFSLQFGEFSEEFDYA
jgi:hypothetical protein